jgi:hypothetical protein
MFPQTGYYPADAVSLSFEVAADAAVGRPGSGHKDRPGIRPHSNDQPLQSSVKNIDSTFVLT